MLRIFQAQRSMIETWKRDRFCDGLIAAELVLAHLIRDCRCGTPRASDALDFCRQLPALCGVVGVPVSLFCDDVDAARVDGN